MSAKTCTYCNATGHYKPKCPARIADLARSAAIEDLNAERNATLPAAKNPMHWEVIASRKALVHAQLLEALGELSTKATAVKHVKAAIKLLEDVR